MYYYVYIFISKQQQLYKVLTSILVFVFFQVVESYYNTGLVIERYVYLTNWSNCNRFIGFRTQIIQTGTYN